MLFLLEIRILQQMITALTAGCCRGEFFSKYHQMRDMMLALPLIAMALLLIVNSTQRTRRDERMSTVRSSAASEQGQPGEQDSAMVQQLVEYPATYMLLSFLDSKLHATLEQHTACQHHSNLALLCWMTTLLPDFC